MNPQAVLAAYIGAFVDELALSGVRHVCICPGSRSAPLALLIARRADLRVWTHVDERSAGFFALGMAKALREPVALLCTSGTAAANFLPAVVEAHLGRVPLVVLTADRPHELRDNGAPQAIDQVRLYGSYAKWFADVAPPDDSPEILRYIRAIAARAVATARLAPAGPVHLNFPLREPLVPARSHVVEGPGARQAVAVTAGTRVLAQDDTGRLSGRLHPEGRGVIICGPQDAPEFPAAVMSLAARLGWPVLADPLSGVRRGPHHSDLVISAYDAFLRDPGFATCMAPEVVLRFGAMPTSKPLLLFLQAHTACRHIVVDDAPAWRDPAALASELVYANPTRLCAQLRSAECGVRSDANAMPNSLHPNLYTRDWVEAERRTRAAIGGKLAGMRGPFEGKVFAELGELLPMGATLFVGSSMPVRDLDTFLPGGEKALSCLSNRGANGIDGVVSSALGASIDGGPLVLVIGDLSFYHDMNGLLAAKQHRLRATIVLLNNDGGGIFSFLPQATETDEFEQLFGTPTGLDFRPAVEMYGGRFLRPPTWETFRAAVREGIAGDGLTVIELRTERDRNVADHRAIWPAVAAAIAGIGEEAAP
ncbi:MAG: 2-succinyl-5-enolpyruvyl-6-hydroxy-3-cyclohexene-1-carboxylic-acid synthase [Chloroflexia bacterium]